MKKILCLRMRGYPAVVGGLKRVTKVNSGRVGRDKSCNE